MSRFARPRTKGNQQADYAKLRLQLADVNPMVASTLRNATPINGHSPQTADIAPPQSVSTHKLERLSNIISNNINAVTDLRQITPYIDKAEIIWSTLMLYPNGQQDKILTYGTQNSKIRNDKLHDELLKEWDSYYTNDYKIERQLRKMLNDILWNTGSYAILNLSRPSLDYLINGSQMKGVEGNESYMASARQELAKDFVQKNGKYVVKNLGRYIRNPKGSLNAVTGIESLFNTSGPNREEEFPLFDFDSDEDNELFSMVTFTDNPACLFLQKISEANRQRNIQEVTGAESYDDLIKSAMGGKDNLEDEEDEVNEKDKKKTKKGKEDDKPEGKGGVDLSSMRQKKEPPEPANKTTNLNMAQQEALQNNIYPHRNPAHQQIQYVKTAAALKAKIYGPGITWHIPSEAVIPIHFNGNSQERLDYILLLDDEGNFLKNTTDFEFYQSSNTKPEDKNKGGSTNSLINNLRRIQEGKECDFDMSEFADMARSSIIKRFIGAVISGESNNISVSLDEETNKIWLSRILRRQSVRCLYVPGECMTYMSFKTNNRLGTGQSLTQMAKMHIARLAAFDLADALANIEGAQPHTLMTVNVEKEDTDPVKHIAMARQNYFRANPRLHGILATAQLSVPQIVDALREQSLTVKVNPGENPHIPTPDIEMSQMDKGNFKPVDDQSRQKVLNDIANYFSLPRSWLDVSDDQNNFQIEALAEHQMILNQVVNWQELFAEQLIDFQRKHADVNEPLMSRLIAIILKNKKLWKPDSGEDLPGETDGQKVKVILADFMANVYCEFPKPTSTETTAKLRDSLDAVKDLIDRWEEMAGHEQLIEPIMTAMGIDTSKASPEEIKAMVKSVFYMDAFKRFNLPMPFDEILGDGKGGGIASIVNSISYMRSNVGDFVTKLLTENAKQNKKLVADGKKVNDALTAAEPEPSPDDIATTDGGNDLNGDDNTSDDNPFQLGGDETNGADDLNPDGNNPDDNDAALNPDDDTSLNNNDDALKPDGVDDETGSKDNPFA